MAEPIGLQKFKSLMNRMLPRGHAWNKKDGSTLSLLNDSIAIEFCRVEERAIDLLKEADPFQTTELVGDWERYLGLPNPCAPDPESQTLEQRRLQIVQKLTRNNGQSVAFFEELLAGFGLEEADFEIVEYTLSRCGEARCGISRLRSLEWMFVIGVNLPGVPADPYMVCVIKTLIPAHTFVFFNFGG